MKDSIQKFNQIRKEEGMQAAEKYAASYIASLNLQTPGEKGIVWSKFKEEATRDLEALEKAEQSEKRKAATEARKLKASIKKVCSDIIKNCGPFPTLTVRESDFINDIKNKRKLTVKQKSWLESIAKKSGVKISGEIEIKGQKATTMSFDEYCEDILDQHIALLSESEIAEARRSFQEYSK